MLLIRTPAVIIAAGGFTANRAMIAAFRPDIDPQTPTTANPRGELLDGSTGDGILMAQAAGAKLVDMSAVEVVPFTGGRLTDFVAETSGSMQRAAASSPKVKLLMLSAALSKLSPKAGCGLFLTSRAIRARRSPSS